MEEKTINFPLIIVYYALKFTTKINSYFVVSILAIQLQLADISHLVILYKNQLHQHLLDHVCDKDGYFHP